MLQQQNSRFSQRSRFAGFKVWKTSRNTNILKVGINICSTYRYAYMFCIVTVVQEKNSLKSTDVIYATSFIAMKTISCHEAWKSKCYENVKVRRLRIIGRICGIHGYRCACVCVGIALRGFFEVNSHITINATCNSHAWSKMLFEVGYITYTVPE